MRTYSHINFFLMSRTANTITKKLFNPEDQLSKRLIFSVKADGYGFDADSPSVRPVILMTGYLCWLLLGILNNVVPKNVFFLPTSSRKPTSKLCTDEISQVTCTFHEYGSYDLIEFLLHLFHKKRMRTRFEIHSLYEKLRNWENYESAAVLPLVAVYRRWENSS